MPRSVQQGGTGGVGGGELARTVQDGKKKRGGNDWAALGNWFAGKFGGGYQKMTRNFEEEKKIGEMIF